MKDEVNKLKMVIAIIDGIEYVDRNKSQKDVFRRYCSTCPDLVTKVIDAYENQLDIRERSVVASKLGFNRNTYETQKKKCFIDIAIEHTLSSPDTISRIYKKALNKLMKTILETEVVISDAY